MKRKFLEAMGLSAEQIDSIMEEHGKTITPIRTQRDAFEEQLETKENELKDLQKTAKDSVTVQQELESLRNDKATLEAKLSGVKLESQIKLAVAKEAHDPDDLLLFINKESLKVSEDGKTIEGLDEELTRLKESKSYLFSAATPPADQDPPNPDDNNPPPPDYTPPAGSSNQPQDTNLAELGKQDALRYTQKTT